jgi:hypothetical protein
MRHGADFSETAEHRASKISGALRFALAAYVIADAAYSLRFHQGQHLDFSS